jgi:hypothetical protein
MNDAKMMIDMENVPVQIKPKLEAAANFYANLLMDPRMVSNIALTIAIEYDNEMQGECFTYDDHKRPRDFKIIIRNKDTDDDIFQTLAHEMVHVKQYAKRELVTGILSVNRNGNLVIYSEWQGKPWKPRAKEDPYFDSPYEIEAYGREVSMRDRFNDYWKSRDESS